MPTSRLAVDLKETVYAFDATTIDLCLSVYPWAPFRSAKAAIKLHTLLDLRGSIPSFIHITDGKTHEVNVLDALTLEPGAFYLLDRGYLDFARLARYSPSAAASSSPAPSAIRFKRRYSHPVDRINTKVLCDQTGHADGLLLRARTTRPPCAAWWCGTRIGKRITFLTNNFA